MSLHYNSDYITFCGDIWRRWAACLAPRVPLRAARRRAQAHLLQRRRNVPPDARMRPDASPDRPSSRSDIPGILRASVRAHPKRWYVRNRANAIRGTPPPALRRAHAHATIAGAAVCCV
ncbi:hypothetical protein HYPSUDRAFT_33726 [Hypholoma sublateritium FD-334 SS-4]|uniref:Uncharacterized protein n=1 Tax=Hypholoma sublateritium (strain FD-334 SS-4) TaxID=945553 RepID=A0A0D2LKR3_HYPSF|nr:hypothetical protein HYPSUDRAFT_33726 [Hypholoma sublateritium FD-334 SS-4]